LILPGITNKTFIDFQSSFMLLNRPVTALMIVLATFIFGFIALRELSVDLLPDIETPSLLVQTNWSGASAREVETRINEPMEAVLSTIPGVSGIHSFARQGQSIVAIDFEWGRDMNLAFLNAREKLDQLRPMLPSQASRPTLIYSSPADEPVAVLAVQPVGQPEPDFATRLELKRWSEQVLTRRLEQQSGIAQAVLVGAVVPEVHIRFRPEDIDRYGLSVASIRNTIRQANVFSASGELRDGWYRYALTIQSRIESLEDIRRIPLSRAQGSERIITLQDVAEVVMDERDPVSFALYDGSQTLTVLVKKDFGSNTVRVYEELLPVLEELRSQYPGISVEVIRENAGFIRNSIRNLLQTLALGGLLAFAVLFVFLRDPRMPLTVGVAIPVSIFLTFFVMYLFGVQLNIISLSGLTLGIGLLVDNAIVVLENINRYRLSGLALVEAARRGTREIALAITASTFTTISVFAPLLFLGGFEGAFFRDQAFTLSVSLLASLLVAIGILPVMVVMVQRRKGRNPVNLGVKEGFSEGLTEESPVGTPGGLLVDTLEGSTEGRTVGVALDSSKGLSMGSLEGESEGNDRFTRGFDAVLNVYERILVRAVVRPVLVLSLTLLLGLLAFWVFLDVPKQILPESEPRFVEYRVSLPANTSLVTTRETAVELSIFLADQASGILVMGGFTDQSNLARLAREGPNRFTIRIPVSGYAMAAEIDLFLQSYISGRSGWNVRTEQTATVFGQLTGGDTAPVLLRIVGQDRELSASAASELDRILVDRGFSDGLVLQYPERVDTWHIRFNVARMLQLGISEAGVIDQLESRARGTMVTEWTREDENISIMLLSAGGRTGNPAESMITVNGVQIPLGRIASVQKVSEPEQLERVRQTPVLSYVAAMGIQDWWKHRSGVREMLADFTRETGIQVRTGGTALQVEQLVGDMLRLLGISLVLIYLILAIQYESLRYPALILAAVPFAWIGSLGMLWILGGSLNTLSFMGILILTGIAVNDAILKVDFMRRYLEQSNPEAQLMRQSNTMQSSAEEPSSDCKTSESNDKSLQKQPVVSYRKQLDEAIQLAGRHRFRPVVMTTVTTILGLIPMLIPFGDGYEFRFALASALIGGMITSTLLTLFVIPTLFRMINVK
jgi:hydrophobic/amphiphilic exporter-1 (mainly G- bacteria), HAE1 family